MQKEISSRSPRGPYAAPIADLSVRFPSIELTTIGVPHSRSHEAEESRLQDRTPPEIVSTDANDMPGRDRRIRSGGI